MPPRKANIVTGNPLWLEWVEDLQRQAEENGQQSAQTYKKAANSLRTCPIVMQHPEQARSLNGIGPSIVQQLTRRQKQYCTANGLEMPEEPQLERNPAPKKKPSGAAAKRQAEQDADDIDAAKAAKRARLVGESQLARAGLDALPGQAPRFLDDPVPVHGGNAVAGPSNPKPRKKAASVNPSSGKLMPDSAEDSDTPHAPAKRKGSTKAYVPKKMSGSYGILIGLYLHATPLENTPWVTKGSLIAKASPYSNTSYETPADGRGDKGQNTYTAWSGKKTLVDKGLLEELDKRPKLWRLSKLGFDLAKTLASKEDGIELLRDLRSDEDPWNGPVDGGQRLGSSAQQKKKGGSGAYDFPNFSSDGDEDPLPHLAVAQAPPPPIDENDEEAQLAEAIRQSLRDAEGPRPRPSVVASSRQALNAGSAAGSSKFRPAGDADGLALPKPLPLPRPNARPLAGEHSSSSSGSAGGLFSRNAEMNGGTSAPARRPLDGRKAASGAYGRHVPEAPPEPANLGVDGPFAYYYLDCDDNRVDRREDAEMSQEDRAPHAAIYRVEYRIAQDLHKIASTLIRRAALVRESPLPGGTTRQGYLRERQSNLVCPGFSLDIEVAGKGKERERNAPSLVPRALLLGSGKDIARPDKQAMYAPPTNVRRIGANVELSSPEPEKRPVPVVRKSYPPPVAPSVPQRVADHVSCSGSGFAVRSSSAPIPAAAPKASTSSTVSRTASAPIPRPPLPGAKRPISTLVQHASYDLLPSHSSNGLIVNRHPLDPVQTTVSTFPADFRFNPIVVPMGTFKIILIVDTRETGMRQAANGKNDMLDGLRKVGVEVEQKMLALGDMIWVARRVHPDGSDAKDLGEDIVLDAIVERKRLDDLCQSILDGRYSSQKARIKESAISHRIYLIEKYQQEVFYAKWRQQIWTSKSQLQINDGFYLHESTNLADTINYLRLRTQVMSETYTAQDLLVIPDNLIDRQTYVGLQKHLRSRYPTSTYLTTYSSFDGLNKSDSALTLRQTWAAMILKVGGVSAEKAVAFLGRWETPKQFFDGARAYQAEVDAENAEKDRAEEGKAKKSKRRKAEEYIVHELDDDSQRAIKGKLAAKIYDMFMCEDAKYPPKE